MTKLVSADSITGITSSANFHGLDRIPPAPTRDELIDGLRREHGQTFDNMLKTIPAGFDLVPVFYSRIDQDENARVMAEYNFFVRPRFLQFLATNYADDLRAIGICDIGIERMTRGVDPANKDGKMYDISIDHIIERSGSGNWGVTQQLDPLQPNNPYPNFLPNHFDNFILLPDHIHQYKNALNELQKPTDCKPGTGTWILMMVPKTSAQHHGYVCPPQPKNSKWHQLEMRPDNMQTRINQASYSLSLARDSLKQLANIPEVAAFLTTAQDIAAQRGLTPVDIANDNMPGTNKTLREAFEDACAVSPDAPYAKQRAFNAATEACETLKKAYDMSASKMKNHKSEREFRSFDDFYSSRAVRRLEETIKMFPCNGAIENHTYLQELSKSIEMTRYRANTGNFNNNKPRR